MPDKPSPKKMKEGTERDAVVSVVAEAVKPTAVSGLLGDVYITSEQKAKSNQDTCETEVLLYKKEPSINASMIPLTWWRKYQYKYPSAAIVAKKYLCTPATSVPSVRVFSTAGDIVTAQSEHLNKLIFLKKNWKPN